MYATLIPFFRVVDNCVREVVVNQQKFEEHKDDIIKVYIFGALGSTCQCEKMGTSEDVP